MLHWITIDKIQDLLSDNGIRFYMNYEKWKIEIDLEQDDKFIEKLRSENSWYRLVWISWWLKPMPK